jgi:chorismate-pyruvate lyase
VNDTPQIIRHNGPLKPRELDYAARRYRLIAVLVAQLLGRDVIAVRTRTKKWAAALHQSRTPIGEAIDRAEREMRDADSNEAGGESPGPGAETPTDGE